MREALHIERLRVGRGGNLETSTQLGSSPAYLTRQMFKQPVPAYLLLTLWVFSELEQ